MKGGTLWLSPAMADPKPFTFQWDVHRLLWDMAELCWERVLGMTCGCKGHSVAFLPAAVLELGCSQEFHRFFFVLLVATPGLKSTPADSSVFFNILIQEKHWFKCYKTVFLKIAPRYQESLKWESFTKHQG